MNIEFDLEKVAKLSYLKLTDAEKKQLADQLPSIVEYVSKLQEVDTSAIETRAYLTDLKNVFRDDVVKMDESERKALIEAFPKEKGGALEVPGVFE